MTHRTILLFAIMSITSITAFCQKAEVVDITETAEIFATKNESEASAKQRAIEAAQLEGLYKAFGMSISQMYEITESSEDGTQAFSISTTDVNGEWIQDLAEPKITVKPSDGGYWYIATVKGRGRRIAREHVDLDVRFLYGLDEDRQQCKGDYDEGDNFYLYFCSPIDGYLTVYLRDDDENQTMQAILPYEGQGGEAYTIKADKKYIFFSKEKAEPEMAKFTRALKLYSRKWVDVNTVYIVFSPNPFSRSKTTANKSEEQTVNIGSQKINLMPRETTAKNFRKWLSKRQCEDYKLQLKQKQITIKKKK